MPQFTYNGQAGSLRIAGQTLLRGRPTELTGAAAKSAAAYAEKYPDRLAGGEADDKPAKAKSAKRTGNSAALAERQALVARAKELGIPAKGKSPDLKAAIEAAEAAAAAGAQA